MVFDFDGVFTDNKVIVDQNGVESVRCDRADGLAFDMLRRYRRKHNLAFDCFILSKEINPVVAARAQKLRLDCVQSIGDKLAYLTQRFGEHRSQDVDPFAGMIYFGNDLNDLPVMTRAGFSIAPGDAHERVKKAASVVMPQRGGHGFIRAAIEQLLDVPGMTLEEIYELVCDR
jgi:N-acylneuraminate cytidylyltransferase